MSFAGNLEDLAIVDVIQLLHSTRKSGTLCVTGDKGRSQIVFHQGFIVSANHYNDAIRIGKILVEMEAISEEALQQALAEQKTAEDKKPLIGMLIEKQAIERDIAYKGLECLIEMTIVEMVSWQKGTFTLDVDVCNINDEYRYIPEKLQQDLNFDTQMVLMDALRIYDEKRAAGEEFGSDFPPEAAESSMPDENAGKHADFSEGAELSADMLGLDAIDQIEVQVVETFTSLEAFDPSEIHRQKVRELLPEFPSAQREELVSYLAQKGNIADSHEYGDHDRNLAILLYGRDELVLHGLMTSCKHDGIMVFTAGTAQEFEHRIAQSIERGLRPVLVFDCPTATTEGFSKNDITALRQQATLRYPQLRTVQIASPTDYIYSLQALTSGATFVIPRSLAENRRDSFVGDFIQFLESFPPFIQGISTQPPLQEPAKATFLTKLKQMRTASEIAFFLLEQTSHYFDRCLTLIVRQDELLAEKSFGIEADKSVGPSAPLRFTIPLKEDCLLGRVVASRTPFFDAVDDRHLRDAIFGEISAPDKSKILLLPLVAAGRTLSLVYADFGQAPIRKIDERYLESLAWIAGMALDQVIKTRNKAG